MSLGLDLGPRLEVRTDFPSLLPARTKVRPYTPRHRHASSFHRFLNLLRHGAFRVHRMVAEEPRELDQFAGKFPVVDI